ncbi:MAG TPA: ATP-binding protein, partial [Chloroflexota bacterium]|nr:ATP-binding protein [Chloroflexota bacterium]
MLNERIVASAAHVLIVLDPGGHVLAANPAARVLLHLPADAAAHEVGAALAEVPELSAAATRALASPAGGITETRQLVGGVPRVLVSQWAPLGDQDGVVISLMDLTPLRGAELRERRSTVLAGVARLTNHVAHELKNPLGALKLYALLLERQLRDTKPDGRELAEKIGRAVDHLSTLVSEVGGFTHGGALDLVPTALADVADAALAVVEERAQTCRVEIVRRYAAGSPTVPADARALREAVLALVRNAVEAMPGGGTLTVEVGGAGAGEWELTVHDTGPGMPGELQSRLFEPFFTTK